MQGEKKRELVLIVRAGRSLSHVQAQEVFQQLLKDLWTDKALPLGEPDIRAEQLQALFQITKPEQISRKIVRPAVEASLLRNI